MDSTQVFSANFIVIVFFSQTPLKDELCRPQVFNSQEFVSPFLVIWMPALKGFIGGIRPPTPPLGSRSAPWKVAPLH